MITQTSGTFSMDYSGMIGIAPFSSTIANEDQNNFMKELLSLQKIDYKIVSVFQNNIYGNHSYVKFGGWDEEAI